MIGKKQQRMIVKEALKALGGKSVEQLSRRVCERFLDSSLFANSSVIMGYMAMRLEASPNLIMQRALDEGKQVVVPVVDFERKEIVPARLKSLTEGLIKDNYGIWQPEIIDPIDVELIDVVIVPALGYDTSGRRLGRGGGYYDKFLAKKGLNAKKCGFCLSCQILEEIATDTHDQPVDYLVTEDTFNKTL
ncbi:MAG: 5-formyltetrahydrofolate cyclo-ligase [Sedimentisphaeraceae bacterium JB056]